MNDKRFIKYHYMLADMLSALLVWSLFMYFRQIVNDGKVFENVQIFIPKYNFISSILVFPFVNLFFHWLGGFYLHSLERNKTSVFLSTLVTTFLTSIVIFFSLLLDDIVVSYLQYYYSLLVLLGLNFVMTFVCRLPITSRVLRNYKTKKWSIRTAIVGNGAIAKQLSQDINRSARNVFAGFILPKNNIKNAEKNVIGTLENIKKTIENQAIESVIIALDTPEEKEVFTVVNRLFDSNVEISFTPRLYEFLTGRTEIDDIRVGALVKVTRLTMPDWQCCVKRFLDIFMSIFALILLTVPMLVIGILIKIDSKGKVFFVQERIGRYGKAFKMIKFRSMHSDAEKNIPQLSSPDDLRMTAIGRYLRKYRIDEIPQFFNVLKGDMSLVGPRPERQFFIKQISENAPYYCMLYKVRPGLTSWAVIKLGYSNTIEQMTERLNYDIVYLENMSLATDLKIVLHTIEIIFKGKGL